MLDFWEQDLDLRDFEYMSAKHLGISIRDKSSISNGTTIDSRKIRRKIGAQHVLRPQIRAYEVYA
jgi:hypothetical protein